MREFLLPHRMPQIWNGVFGPSWRRYLLNFGTWNPLHSEPLKRNWDNIGPTGLSATWHRMLLTSRPWRKWWEIEIIMRSSFTSWVMLVSVLFGNGALPLRNYGNKGVFRSHGRRNRSVVFFQTSRRKSVPQTTSSRHGTPWSGSVPSSRLWMYSNSALSVEEEVAPGDIGLDGYYPSEDGCGPCPAKEVILAMERGGRLRWRWPSRLGRPSMHSFWGWSDSKWGVAPASMTFNTRVQAQWRLHPIR